jgi:hypothetical protein
VNASRGAEHCYPEGTFLVGGEFVGTFTGEYALEDQVAHLELPITHEPLVIASECLTVPCISHNCLPCSLLDEVNVIMPELTLCGFVVCLDMGGAHGDLRWEDDYNPVHQEKRHLPCGSTG